MERKRYTIEEWQAIGRRRFGDDVDDWKFTCPSCGLTQSRADFKAMGMGAMQADWYVGYSCIGHFRQTPPVVDAFDMNQGAGCRYQGGLAPNISPIEIQTGPEEWRPTFGFQPCPICNDDGVLCASCGLRVVNCCCGSEEFRDCDECTP